jgi:DNA polymerase-3 subunit alpha
MDTIHETIVECQRLRIPVLPPDVNESFGDFTTVKNAETGDKIRFGLFTIKNLGTEIANAIVAERKARGHFTSVANFLERVNHHLLNKKSLEALTKAGALDSLGEERGCLLFNMDNLLMYHQDTRKAGDNQSSLFGLMTDQSTVPQLKLKPCPPTNAKEKLAWEKELLGLYISGHPLDEFKDKFQNDQHTIRHVREAKEGQSVLVAGLIEELREINTKKGEPMVFMKLVDYTGTIEAVIFPRTLKEYKSILVPEKCIALRGRLSLRNGEPSIVAEKLKTL